MKVLVYYVHVCAKGMVSKPIRAARGLVVGDSFSVYLAEVQLHGQWTSCTRCTMTTIEYREWSPVELTTLVLMSFEDESTAKQWFES